MKTFFVSDLTENFDFNGFGIFSYSKDVLRENSNFSIKANLILKKEENVNKLYLKEKDEYSRIYKIESSFDYVKGLKNNDIFKFENEKIIKIEEKDVEKEASIFYSKFLSSENIEKMLESKISIDFFKKCKKLRMHGSAKETQEENADIIKGKMYELYTKNDFDFRILEQYFGKEKMVDHFLWVYSIFKLFHI